MTYDEIHPPAFPSRKYGPQDLAALSSALTAQNTAVTSVLTAKITQNIVSEERARGGNVPTIRPSANMRLSEVRRTSPVC